MNTFSQSVKKSLSAPDLSISSLMTALDTVGIPCTITCGSAALRAWITKYIFWCAAMPFELSFPSDGYTFNLVPTIEVVVTKPIKDKVDVMSIASDEVCGPRY